MGLLLGMTVHRKLPYIGVCEKFQVVVNQRLTGLQF